MIHYNGNTHKKRFVDTVTHNPYRLSKVQLAAFYLISSDNTLWRALRQFARKDRIDFNCTGIREGSPTCYLLGKVTQDLCGESSHLTLKDLCDCDLVNSKDFNLIITALCIARKGYEYTEIKKTFN